MIQQPFVVRFVYKAPVFLLGMVGYLYAARIFYNYDEDTTAVTNTAFAIMTSLAAVSFSFARVIEGDDLRNRVTFAGERVLHGALLVLVASLLKYFVFMIVSVPKVAAISQVKTMLLVTVGVLVGLAFANGILFAHTGLRILNDLLLLRMTRERDWDDMW